MVVVGYGVAEYDVWCSDVVLPGVMCGDVAGCEV